MVRASLTGSSPAEESVGGQNVQGTSKCRMDIRTRRLFSWSFTRTIPPPDTPLNERVTYRTHVVTDHHGPQPVLDGPVPNLLSHSPDGTCVRHPSL